MTKIIEKKLLRTVSQTITENSMVQPGDSVLAAVSGGPDSVALVHILSKLTPVFSFRLAVAHLNHDLRSHESERDAEFVTSFAQKLKLPFHIDKINVRRYQKRHRLSPEEAARQVRYGFFNQVAESHGYAKIAVGHQLDDNAELVMMFLLRGSGTLGLSGMPPNRDGKIIRPLLKVKRSEIIDYLAEQDLEYVIDATNANLNYLRNKIRHELIPQLSSTYNPNIVAALNRLASLVRSEEKWIDGLVEPIFKSALISQNDDSIRLALNNFGDIAPAARRRLIRKAILKLNGTLRRITFAHVDAAVDLAMKRPPSGGIDLPHNIRVQCDHRSLIIAKHKDPLRSRGLILNRAMTEDYEYQMTIPGTTIIKEAQIRLKLTEIGIEEIKDLYSAGQRIAFFDITKLKFPLVVRNLRPGDRFSPLGLQGTQKLKKFFINHKIPRNQRANCPLLVSDGRIVWVAGHRLDNSVKIDAETRLVLKAELLLA